MKHIPTYEEFVNEALDVTKNAKKLDAFGGILPVKIIHAEDSNSYMDSGSNVTDRIIPDLNNLQKDYSIDIEEGKYGGLIRLIKNKNSPAIGQITYSTVYGAERIISYQNSKMIAQSWYLNYIFKTAKEAEDAFKNLVKKYS